MKKGSCVMMLLFLFFLWGCMQCPGVADIPKNETQTVTVPVDEDGGGVPETGGTTAQPAGIPAPVLIRDERHPTP